jgi:hypothetical protein
MIDTATKQHLSPAIEDFKRIQSLELQIRVGKSLLADETKGHDYARERTRLAEKRIVELEGLAKTLSEAYEKAAARIKELEAKP